RYSVPWQFAGQWLVTRETPDGWLEILDGDEVVAVHPLLPESTRFRPVLIPEHHVVPPDHAADTVRVLPAPDVEQRPLSVYELAASGGRSS
ncbi:MAG: hypothetical protein FWJ65_13205, partial [Limnochordales bacterium]